jgi:ATP-binding cassette subfamily G (WHITE) protein 2 (SNQ2)
LAYAEEVIDILELGPIADALVGNADVGGLGVEERKRLTIAVELAAKPDFVRVLFRYIFCFFQMKYLHS